jgi:hypothetical protein
LDPFAYVLRDLAIVQEPISVDLSQLTQTDVPASWKQGSEDSLSELLPLVKDQAGRFVPGWCTYTYEHIQAPELEVLCGGVNSKTPAAGAIWRQGHLLHFGFEPSPAELNDSGRALLVNSICYIARFTEDRPIVRTPSPFYSGVRLLDRGAIARLVANTERDLQLFLDFYLAAELRPATRELDREGVGQWFHEVAPYLRADVEGKFVIDAEAQQFGMAPDQPEFFEKAIAALRAADRHSEQVRKLLGRYAPEGPEAANSSADDWDQWWSENRAYLFFSDTGGFRWYLDPLAKRRGVPTEELRGSSRSTAAHSTRSKP